MHNKTVQSVIWSRAFVRIQDVYLDTHESGPETWRRLYPNASPVYEINEECIPPASTLIHTYFLHTFMDEVFSFFQIVR